MQKDSQKLFEFLKDIPIPSLTVEQNKIEGKLTEKQNYESLIGIEMVIMAQTRSFMFSCTF